MNLTQFSTETQLAVKIAKEASKLTNGYFRGTFQQRDKGSYQGIVTEADEKSEALLRRTILAEFPNHEILGEENGRETTQIQHSETQYSATGIPLWILDPIDGTTNFANGNSYHCISIAFGYQIGKCFKPKSACIARPFLNEYFFAEKGRGSFYLANEKTINLRVAECSDLKSASIASGFSSHHGQELYNMSNLLAKVHEKARGIRINGAAALDLAHTAQGTITAFFEAKLSPWDLAAGDLIISEAGGVCKNFQAQPFDALRDSNIVAGPENIVNSLLKIIHG